MTMASNAPILYYPLLVLPSQQMRTEVVAAVAMEDMTARNSGIGGGIGGNNGSGGPGGESGNDGGRQQSAKR
jgi:hypothetical protein